MVRGQKLQRGKTLVFADTYATKEGEEDNPNTPSEDKIIRTYETVYLFQWLIPIELLQRNKILKEEEPKKVLYPKFSEQFLKKEEAKQEYLSRFIECEKPQEDKPEVRLKPLEIPQSEPYEEDFEEENNQDPTSSDRQERAPVGLGLDLTKAKKVQQELLQGPERPQVSEESKSSHR